MLTALLIYGYATGMYSSRAIEKASYESIAVRYIAANEHPDHDTLCAFRRRFLSEVEKLFVQVLQIAKQMKLLRLGTVALDGTKIHANASRHNALSYGRAQKIEEQLRAEVQELLARAEAADSTPLPAGLSVPEELARREDRLAAIAEAKAKIEARAAVDTESMLMVGARLTHSPVDVRQLVPMLDELSTRPEPLGRPSRVLADAGYFSQANTEHSHAPGVEPLIARRRDQHCTPWLDRLVEPSPTEETASPVDRMAHRMRTQEGRALYGLRKQTVEPVFGIIKSVMRFRQFLLRGLAKMTSEWDMVAMAWNVRRMAVLAR